MSVLTQHPAEVSGAPGRVIEKAAERCGGFDGCAFRQWSAGTVEQQVKEDLEGFPMLLAGEAVQDVRIELSGTLSFWVHTPNMGPKARSRHPFSKLQDVS